MRIASVGALVAAAALTTSEPARASLGGPLTVEVLGWNPEDERLYVRQVGHDESGGERDCVFYFDLRAHDPARTWVVRASLQRWSPDAAEMAGFERERRRLEGFLSGLEPLERADEGREGLLRNATVEADSIRSTKILVMSFGPPSEMVLPLSSFRLLILDLASSAYGGACTSNCPIPVWPVDACPMPSGKNDCACGLRSSM